MKLRIFCLLLVFTILLIPTGCQNYKPQLDELQRQYDELLQQNQQLQEELQEALDELELYQGTGIRVYSGIQPGVIRNELMEEVVLINKEATRNPTWDELMSFLGQDATDSMLYGPQLLCGGFAEALHNNAERAGIASAFMAINFEEGIGHAINAFNTSDKGLVYIDCTGDDTHSTHLPGYIYIGDTGSHDTIAYLEIGEPIGHINIGLSYGLDYSDYEQWKLDVQAMIDRFNEATTNE
ncbi:MAG TPA: hypothetical protein G4O19_02665 [Dehalococcoidia bacterium]|nr:hypothetical protein [Dehalococcoidia bacterium]